MPDAAPLEPGDPRSLGQYEVIGRLGAGGQGAVYLGKDSGGAYVAIKLLHAQFAADPSARARFTREVTAAQKVAPFCTSRVIEADVQGDQPYIVSEFIDGPSLHDVVAQNGPRGADELQRLAIGTVTALAAIHEAGIVHRDFKPNNVLLAADGPRVVDFGIARTVNSQESAVTATGMVVGTPGYLAPEQLTGVPLQASVDIFAWATTMVFAATGQSPFEADTLPVIINRILNEHPDLSALPEPLRGVVGRCLAKEPAHRPTAPQLLLELLGQAGVAPASQASDSKKLLGEGTRIAALMAPPPSVTPAWQQRPVSPPPLTPPPLTPPPLTPPPLTPPPLTPPVFSPPPLTPPPMPIQQQATPQAGPPTPPPMPMPHFPGAGPATPPPMYLPQPPSQQQGPPAGYGAPPAHPPAHMPSAYPPAPPKKSKAPMIVGLGCGGAVLLVIVLMIVLVAVLSNSGDKGATPRTTGSAASSGASQYSPPTAYSGYGAPPAFAGTWSGSGSQGSPPKTWNLEVTLKAGRTIGQMKYSPGTCQGTLIVRDVTATTIEARQLVSVTGCNATGYVKLRLVAPDQMVYEWRKYDSDTQPGVSGTLLRRP